MKVIYMGTPEFSVEPLEKIIQAGHQVLLVVTQPDRQKGRGREVRLTPVKECALRHGIPVFQPQKIKSPEAVGELANYPADIYVVAAFGQLLSEEILRLPALGCINIHASLLPFYRGAAPIQRVIIEGEKETGITIMQMDKGLDTGDILLQQSVPVEAWETADSLHDKLSAVGAGLVTEALSRLESGGIPARKQEHELSTYAPMLTKEEGQIRWELPAEQIERLIRGLNSWPSAYTFYKGKTLKIWTASLDSCQDGNDDDDPAGASVRSGCRPDTALPGTVLRAEGTGIAVAAGAGILKIHELQLEGKKRMPAKDFLLGHSISPGEILGQIANNL